MCSTWLPTVRGEIDRRRRDLLVRKAADQQREDLHLARAQAGRERCAPATDRCPAAARTASTAAPSRRPARASSRSTDRAATGSSGRPGVVGPRAWPDRPRLRQGPAPPAGSRRRSAPAGTRSRRPAHGTCRRRAPISAKRGWRRRTRSVRYGTVRDSFPFESARGARAGPRSRLETPMVPSRQTSPARSTSADVVGRQCARPGSRPQRAQPRPGSARGTTAT